jgi:CBS domain-containing protein
MSAPVEVDAALAPLRARLSAARLIDAVGGGAHLASSSSSPSAPSPPPPAAMDVATLDHDQTVGDALYLLARRRILSAPLVVDPAVALEDEERERAEELGFGADDDDAAANATANRPPALLGWLGLREVVQALHEHLAQAAEHSGKPLPTGMLALMTALHAESPKFLQKRLVTLRDADDSALVYQADQTAPLLTVVRDVFCAPCGRFGQGLGAEEEDEEDEKMEEAAAATAAAAAASAANPTAAPVPAIPLTVETQTKEQRQQQRQRRRRRRRGAHRLAVFDPLGRLTHVVSQLDVVRFLQARCATELAAASKLSLRQLGLHPPRPGAPLVTLQPHTPTLFALERMVREGVNGAAVVGPRGDIVANLSLSDCRCMQGAKDLAALALPVAEFLALSHGTSYLGYSAGARGGGVGGGQRSAPFRGGGGGAAAAGGAGGGGRGTMPPPPPHQQQQQQQALRSAGSAGTPPTFFAAAARAAAARNGGGATPPDSGSAHASLSSTPVPASPAFGAGGSPRLFGAAAGAGVGPGGGAGAAGGAGGGAAATTTGVTPPKLVRLSSGGISSAGGCGYPAPAGGNGAAAAAGGGPAPTLQAQRSASLTAEEAAVADEADHVVRLITADPDRATLADVVALMARHHVHRVFLVEKEGGEAATNGSGGKAAAGGVARTAAVPAVGGGGGTVPGVGRVTGVVTPTDILELLAGKAPPQQA